MKKEHTKISKEIVDEAKAFEKGASQVAIDSVTAFFTENPNARLCVQELDVGGNSKALQAAIQHINKKYQRAAYFFTVDHEEGKVIHMNSLPKSDISQNFNAKEWIRAVSDIIGGRGGGKDDSAQGVGTDPAKVQRAIEEAKQSYNQALKTL